MPRAAPGDDVRGIRLTLIGATFESPVDVAVLDGERLVGLIPLGRLLSADDAATAAELMDPDPPVVRGDLAQERVAWKALDHGETSIAVVDDADRFVGIITPRQLLTVVLAEHDEDLARIGGYLASTSEARSASEERVARRLVHRLPWLLVGLAGALAAAGVVGRFEDSLSDTLLLASFIPGIVYMADAVGTQTEALIIRGLSVGVPIRDVVRRELLTGVLAGLFVGAVFAPVAWAVWGDGEVAVAVAIALVAACSTATAVAMLLPWAISRTGRDPAFGSGPLATVVQDLLSLVIYFVVAGVVVG